MGTGAATHAVMACAEWIETISAGLDGEIDDLEARRLAHHLERCPSCRAVEHRMQDLDRQLGPLLHLVGTPTVSAVDAAAIVGHRSRRHRAVTRARPVAAVLAAAAAVLVFGVVIPARSDDARPGPRHAAVALRSDAPEPGSVTIGTGGTVEFRNDGDLTHDLTRDLPSATVAATLAPGDADSVTYEVEGSFAYHCTIHPWVRGRVEVTS